MFKKLNFCLYISGLLLCKSLICNSLSTNVPPIQMENLPEDLAWDKDNIETIAYCLSKHPDGGLVIFDADGTLWADSLGGAFLSWLASENKLHFNSKDIPDTYEKRIRENPSEGYVWATTILAGIDEEELVEWANNFFDEHFINRIYQPQKDLIAVLKELDFDVWVVSSNNRWITTVGAKHLGVDSDHVIGMDVELVQGKLTDRLKGPVIYGEGKIQALKELTNAVANVAVGDTTSDVDILSYSNCHSLIIMHNPDEIGHLRALPDNHYFVLEFLPLVQPWRPERPMKLDDKVATIALEAITSVQPWPSQNSVGVTYDKVAKIALEAIPLGNSFNE